MTSLSLQLKVEPRRGPRSGNVPQRGSLEYRGKKKSQTLGQINLPLGNWVTLNSSRLYLDPRANVISSVSAKPSPNYSEGK